MYLGIIVEIGATDELFTAPKHEYTRALLNADRHAGSAKDGDWRAFCGPLALTTSAARRNDGQISSV
jgi:ABC-type dipeptide/oligopeptide/nickel transport system ATPase component